MSPVSLLTRLRADCEARSQADEDDEALDHIERAERRQQHVLHALVVSDGACELFPLVRLVGEELDRLVVEQRVGGLGALRVVEAVQIPGRQRRCSVPTLSHHWHFANREIASGPGKGRRGGGETSCCQRLR